MFQSSPIGQPRHVRRCSWSQPNPSPGGGVHSKATWSPATATIWLSHSHSTKSGLDSNPINECCPGSLRMQSSSCRSVGSVSLYHSSQPVRKSRMSPGLMIVFWKVKVSLISERVMERPLLTSIFSFLDAAQEAKSINTPRPQIPPLCNQSAKTMMSSNLTNDLLYQLTMRAQSIGHLKIGNSILVVKLSG